MNEYVNTEELLQASQPAETPAEQPVQRYQLFQAADALQAQEPITWVVQDLISAGSLSMVVGEPGSKKTYSMLDLSVAVAGGETWLKFPTKRCPVLLIDEESGPRSLARRLGNVLRGHQADGQTPLHYVSCAAFDLGTAEDVSEIHNLILRTGARFVLIDALADVMPGRDENSVQFVQPIFMALRRIAEKTRAAIVIIHHCNKAGGYRGSSAIKGAVDLMLLVESRPASPVIDFKTEKARDSEPCIFTGFARFEQNAFSLSGNGKRPFVRLKPAQDFIVRFLQGKQDASLNDICSSSPKWTANTLRKELNLLTQEKTGFVERVRGAGTGGRGLIAFYALTQKALEYNKLFNIPNYTLPQVT